VGIAIAIVVAVVVIGAVIIVALQRRSQPSTGRETPTGERPSTDTTPMTGLESALDQVTDSSGRPLRELLDDEQATVDDLRVPDDTGPLLRRALDEFADDTAANERPHPQPPDE